MGTPPKTLSGRELPTVRLVSSEPSTEVLGPHQDSHTCPRTPPRSAWDRFLPQIPAAAATVPIPTLLGPVKSALTSLAPPSKPKRARLSLATCTPNTHTHTHTRTHAHFSRLHRQTAFTRSHWGRSGAGRGRIGQSPAPVLTVVHPPCPCILAISLAVCPVLRVPRPARAPRRSCLGGGAFRGPAPLDVSLAGCGQGGSRSSQ